MLRRRGVEGGRAGASVIPMKATSISSDLISGGTVGVGNPGNDDVRLGSGRSVRVDVACWAGRSGRRRRVLFGGEGTSERYTINFGQHKFPS